MAIDRIDWHAEGDFPENLPYEAGGTHIGFFLYWIITRDHLGEEHREEPESLAAAEEVTFGKMTGRDFLLKFCDGKFWDVDVDSSILPFVNWYYTENVYYGDLEEHLTPQYESIYHAEDSRENAEAIANIIDRRLEKWREKT